MSFPRTAALCALLLLLASPAMAQQVINPKQLEEDHPRARRAGEVVTLMLEKNQAAVEAYLKQHGDASYAGSAQMKEQVEKHLARLNGRAFEIDRFDEGRGNDVIVILRGEDGAMENVVVQMKGEAPHRITGLLRAMIQTQ